MTQFIMLVYIHFLFNDPATTEIYTLSLHDALPIWPAAARADATGLARSRQSAVASTCFGPPVKPVRLQDRKSTRLNSSHSSISYAVFCLKKKKTETATHLVSTTRP